MTPNPTTDSSVDRKHLLDELNNSVQMISVLKGVRGIHRNEINGLDGRINALNNRCLSINDSLSKLHKPKDRPLRFLMIDILKEEAPIMYDELKEAAIKKKESAT